MPELTVTELGAPDQSVPDVVASQVPPPFPVDAEAGRRTYELDRRHVFHSWSAQAALRPMVLAAASGSWVWDADGTRYLDFSSQLVNTNIGHQHPRVVAAIQQQAGRLCTVAPQHANDQRSEAARLIAELAPPGLDKVFFTNGGAEAIENAVRMARLHTGRTKVLSTYRSYHGGTATAVNLTGDPRRWPNEQGSSGFVHFFGPFLYRSAYHASTEQEESERALAHLEQLIAFEGPATIAAIVLETVPGTAGVMPPPPGYLAGVRALCDRYGIVYVADEVMAGFGRTGRWFAVEHWDVVPDLIAFAKGVNSGYVPLGGVILSDAVAATFDDRVYPGGLTYSGHPLACAAAVATIGAMRDEGIVDNAARIGTEVLGPGLRALAERHPSVGEVRGLGVFWALDLVVDRSTREPLAPYGGTSPAMTELVAACRRRGLLPFTNYHRLHVVPPCTVSREEAELGLAVLDEALSVADAHTTGGTP
ncbi:MAG: aspartate aminotransferase family protein [Frankiaceae bacterium]|nr:aspartate aminotransferase family protein [Frankiaceae bacterium]